MILEDLCEDVSGCKDPNSALKPYKPETAVERVCRAFVGSRKDSGASTLLPSSAHLGFIVGCKV